jgi:1-acyl-sn-glycerol-3-phosphate acyltransferase
MNQQWFFYRMMRGIFRFTLTTFFDFKAYGVNHIPRTGGVLMVSNHESYLDPALVGVAVPRILSYMAKSELFENKYFGWYIRQLHAFPVKQGRGDIGAMRETIERLKEGNLLNIFPEGSRSEDGQLGEIQPGAALVVRRAQVPVVPCFIIGSHKSWPKGQKLPKPTRLRVLYRPAMELHHLKADKITQIIDETFHSMREELLQIIASEDEPWALRKSTN